MVRAEIPSLNYTTNVFYDEAITNELEVLQSKLCYHEFPSFRAELNIPPQNNATHTSNVLIH